MRWVFDLSAKTDLLLVYPGGLQKVANYFGKMGALNNRTGQTRQPHMYCGTVPEDFIWRQIWTWSFITAEAHRCLTFLCLTHMRDQRPSSAQEERTDSPPSLLYTQHLGSLSLRHSVSKKGAPRNSPSPWADTQPITIPHWVST